MKQRYIKPNGTEITVNDTEDNRALASSLGWKKPPGRKRKAENDDSRTDSGKGA